MKHLPLFTTAVLFLSLFFISCEKEYSCEGCAGASLAGTAIYSLNGGTASCTGAVVSGSYVAGTAVTAGNTVLLQVQVDSIGSYAVSSTNNNGLVFSGSGNFTGTGSQSILLTATGTPVAAGDFNYTAGTPGCSFTVTASPAIDTSYLYYYQASIDGVAYRQTVTSSNGYEATASVQGTNDVVLVSNILPITYPPMPAGNTGMTVSKGILLNYLTVNNTGFITFFNLGEYPFTPTPSISDGATITWYDESGTEWSTANAPADQSGSLFKVVNVSEVLASSPYVVIITFNFNCTLYDAFGNSKTLTNGIYKGTFIKL